MRKPHVVLLVASLLAIVVYLLTPVFMAMIVFGFSGLQSIRLVNFWFLLPPLLMLMVAILAVFGNKGLSLTGAGVLSLVMLLFMFMMKDLVKGGNVNNLLQFLNMDATKTTITDLALTVFINPAWGFILSFVLVLAGLILTVILPDGSSSGNSGGSRGQNNQGSGRAGVSPRSGSGSSYNKLY